MKLRHTATARTPQSGLTLIELLVAMVIGLAVTLAITSVVIVGEAHKRTTTSTNDMGQTGAYAAYVLDRTLRSAGAGIVQSWNTGGVFGCRLSAARNGSAILPRLTAFPAPFSGFLGGSGVTHSGTLSVAPLLIANNQSDAGSDVLVVMSGSAGNVARAIRPPGPGTPDDGFRLDNTIGLSAGDIQLVSQSGTQDCLIEQVSPNFIGSSGNQTLPFNGAAYYTAAATGATTSFSAFRSSGLAQLTTLGNANANNLHFQLIGVGANRTLFGYDLLQIDGSDTPQAMADGVVELRAVYGLDTNNDGVLDGWTAPINDFNIATLMTTPARLRQIVAVRVALVLRSSNYEKETVAPASLELFSDLSNAAGTSLQQTIDLSTSTGYPHYRYRAVEMTIPLRNMLLLP